MEETNVIIKTEKLSYVIKKGKQIRMLEIWCTCKYGQREQEGRHETDHDRKTKRLLYI